MPLATGQAIGAGKEIEVLVAIDVGIGAKVIGHKAEAAPHAIGVVDTREAIHVGVAGGRQVKRRQNPHACGLASAVRSDVAKHLPLADVKRHVLYRARHAKEAMQAAELDHRAGSASDHFVASRYLPRMTWKLASSFSGPTPVITSGEVSTIAI